MERSDMAILKIRNLFCNNHT